MTLLAYIDLTPFLFCGNAALLLVVLVVAGVVARSPRRRLMAIAVASIAVVASVAFWISFAVFTDVKREMAFDMNWSIAEKSQSYPDADHIVLRFKSHPNHFVGIYSNDLRRYLETLPGHEVTVVFSVTTDFGKTRGFREIRIGDLRSWNSVNGYAGNNGNSKPSPWP